jgi:molecular chaperone GrpE
MSTESDERIVDKRSASRMSGEDAASAEPPEQADASDPSAEAELAAAKEKADSYYAQWQRSAADFANYKRRVEEERAEQARFANAALVINLLPVYDDLDRAIATVDAHLAGLTWVQGIEAIYRKFGHLLDAMSVKEIEAEGKEFDPSKHEAVGQSAGPEGQVLHVVQKGYLLGDKVLRPAMVIVGSGGATETNTEA